MAKIKNPVTIVQQSGGGQTENKFTELVDGSITTITAEDLAGTTSIRNYAFYQLNNLINITIPNSVTSIGNSSFQNCRGLTGITIPSSVTSIGNSAFYMCGNLSNVIIQNGVVNIGNASFLSCTKLTNISIPASVTYINTSAFSGCWSLNTIVFNGQVPNILSSTFRDCPVTIYDFRNCNTVPTLYDIYSLGHASGCQIIIPDALYDTWTTSSVWSDLTDVTFVKASEYVE